MQDHNAPPLMLSVGALVGGGLLIRIPLKHWLGNFDRVRQRESDILSGAVEVSALLGSDAPMEIRHTFDILSRRRRRLSGIHASAEGRDRDQSRRSECHARMVRG